MTMGQIWNDPRSLLSLHEGRLQALKLTVSKPDATAEREQMLYSYLLEICQEFMGCVKRAFEMSKAQPTQHG